MIKLTRQPCPNPTALLTDYKVKENKDALKASSHEKCMYCESHFDSTDYGDVEHIQPKSKYPHLKFSWDNLGYSCVKCNRENKREEWEPNFINPFETDPADHLQAIGGIIWPINNSDRAQLTIDILGLNRTPLVMRRSNCLTELGNLIVRHNALPIGAQKNAVKNLILKEISNASEYSFFKKDFIEKTVV